MCCWMNSALHMKHPADEETEADTSTIMIYLCNVGGPSSTSDSTTLLYTIIIPAVRYGASRANLYHTLQISRQANRLLLDIHENTSGVRTLGMISTIAHMMIPQRRCFSRVCASCTQICNYLHIYISDIKMYAHILYVQLFIYEYVISDSTDYLW